MKKIIFLMIILSFSTVHAASGWSESYGGDGVVVDFVSTALELVSAMEQMPERTTPAFTNKFRKAIQNAKIESLESVMDKGVRVTVVTDPKSSPVKIKIDRASWIALRASWDFVFIEKLILHQFLIAQKTEDNNNHYTDKLYEVVHASRMKMAQINGINLQGTILDASYDCNREKFALLLKWGADFNYLDGFNQNPLFLAASAGCDTIVSQLMSLHAKTVVRVNDFWDPWFGAFVGSHDAHTYGQYIKYVGILKNMKLYFNAVDENKKASFPADKFPPQLSFCAGQTMFIRSIIGINFFKDETRKESVNIRRLNIAGLLKDQGASLDLKDACGKSARDYAKIYGVDLDTLTPDWKN